MRIGLFTIAAALAICTPAACERSAPSASIGVGNPHPASSYVCEGTRLDVRLMGESASVAVDGAPAVTLPATGESGTTFSNGRQTLIIEQGQTSWVRRARHAGCVHRRVTRENAHSRASTAFPRTREPLSCG